MGNSWTQQKANKKRERQSVWENDCGEKCASKTDFNRKYEGSSQSCTAPIPNKIQHQEKGQQIKRMRIEKSSENIIIFGMSVAKRPRDISVSDDLWNVKLTFIGRLLLNSIYFYLFIRLEFYFLFCFVLSWSIELMYISFAHQTTRKRSTWERKMWERNTTIALRKTILLKDLLTNYREEKKLRFLHWSKDGYGHRTLKGDSDITLNWKHMLESFWAIVLLVEIHNARTINKCICCSTYRKSQCTHTYLMLSLS